MAVFISDTAGRNSLGFEMELEAELERLISMSVDVRVINHAPLTFAYNVLKEGSVLVDKDPLLRGRTSKAASARSTLIFGIFARNI